VIVLTISTKFVGDGDSDVSPIGGLVSRYVIGLAGRRFLLETQIVYTVLELVLGVLTEGQDDDCFFKIVQYHTVTLPHHSELSNDLFKYLIVKESI
jgi:hypothetical protein